jgi:hypothetical protein
MKHLMFLLVLAAVVAADNYTFKYDDGNPGLIQNHSNGAVWICPQDSICEYPNPYLNITEIEVYNHCDYSMIELQVWSCNGDSLPGEMLLSIPNLWIYDGWTSIPCDLTVQGNFWLVIHAPNWFFTTDAQTLEPQHTYLFDGPLWGPSSYQQGDLLLRCYGTEPLALTPLTWGAIKTSVQ